MYFSPAMLSTQIAAAAAIHQIAGWRVAKKRPPDAEPGHDPGLVCDDFPGALPPDFR